MDKDNNEERLIDYLKSARTSLEHPDTFEKIHIVLGNESCDLDSSISATILAFLLHKTRLNGIPEDALVVPIQNVSKENFLIRSDNCNIYQEIGIPLGLLIYKDQIDIEDLVLSKDVTTTLVDHHMLSKDLEILESTVVNIFDHRPLESGTNWDQNKVEIVMNEVGSCSTLITDLFISSAEQLLSKELAYLLYATIVVDCKALDPSKGKARELDCKMAELLEKKYNFNDTRRTLFKKIMNLRTNVSNLTPKQILYKDTKIIKGVPMPSLPMLVENFLKLKGGYEALKEFAAESGTSVVVLKGADRGRKDVAVFGNAGSEELKANILEIFFNNKEYDFQFSKQKTIYRNITLLNQGNLKLSRKQLVPLIEYALSNNSVRLG
ncbi:exopolyphosphatase PRUNE1-like [Diorhabda carinulata]|uniref:exopolyphosphatase PRUNE1-like n=1 Tax=Diorhabda carinulata TaxID=1163345 RepID=UPI0025A187A3|nr:exopolyphosphatase PRUNE1-like [Diorhabda carinulata]